MTLLARICITSLLLLLVGTAAGFADPNGNTLTYCDAGIVSFTGNTTTYAYDAANRLTDVTAANGTTTYRYDAAGNRVYRTLNGVQTQYTYNANDQLIQAGGNHYSYDANGNTTSQTQDGQSTSYTYDAQNRLTQVTTQSASGSQTVSYTYNAQDIRTGKTQAGTTTHYVIDANRPYAQVLAEIQAPVGASPAGGPSKTYVYGLDRISQTQPQTGQTRYYLTDGLGSTRALTDNTGTVTDTYDYSAYGNLLNHSGSTDNNYRYTGEQYDSETQNYYLRARYLNPTTGRFTQRDTYDGNLQRPITQNHYLYGNANPLTYTDPSGHLGLVEQSVALNVAGVLGDMQIQTGLSAFDTLLSSLPVDKKIKDQLRHYQLAIVVVALGASGFQLTKLLRGTARKLVTKLAVKRIEKLLRPSGKLIGWVEKGATDNIRTISQADFIRLRLKLTKMAGNPVPKATYDKGPWYKLPGGGEFGIRESKKFGTTLDLHLPGFPPDLKVHYK